MRYVVLTAALALSTAAGAQTASRAQEEGPRTPVAARQGGGAPPQRIRSVTVQPGERCPTAQGDEVVVCYRPDGSPYRIPAPLRDDGPIPAENQSWVNRAATVDQVSRVNGGLPDTCSPVGTGGQSGCAQAATRAWAAEKRAQRRAEESVPGGQE